MENSTTPKYIYKPRAMEIADLSQLPTQLIVTSNNTCVLLNSKQSLIIDLQTHKTSAIDSKLESILKSKLNFFLIPHKNGGFLLFDKYGYHFIASNLVAEKPKTASGYFSHLGTWGVHQTGDIYMHFFDSTMQKEYVGDAYRFGSSCIYGSAGKLTADGAYEIVDKGKNQVQLKSLMIFKPGEVPIVETDHVYDKNKLIMTIDLPRAYNYGIPSHKIQLKDDTVRCNMWLIGKDSVIVGSRQGSKFTLYHINYVNNTETVLKEFDDVETGVINSVNEEKGMMFLTLQSKDQTHKHVIYYYKCDYVALETQSGVQLSRIEYQLSPDFKHFVKVEKQEQHQCPRLTHYQLVETRKCYFHFWKQTYLEERYGEGLIRRVLRLLDL